MSAAPAVVEESVRSLIAAWERFVHGIPGGRFEAYDGGTAAWADVPLPFLNACFVDTPVAGERELRRRLDAALEYVAGERHPWFVFACEEWMPRSWRSVVADAGLHVAMPMTGMVTERLLPPRRPAPALAVRRVDDAASRRAVTELNDRAYGLPAGLCASLGEPGLWARDVFGCVGSVDGQPVSTATVFPALDTLYVAMVATHPDHGRKGYAEHVMRQALGQAAPALGMQRTILHATEAGRPVYAAMGYATAARFALLSTEEPH